MFAFKILPVAFIRAPIPCTLPAKPVLNLPSSSNFASWSFAPALISSNWGMAPPNNLFIPSKALPDKPCALSIFFADWNSFWRALSISLAWSIWADNPLDISIKTFASSVLPAFIASKPFLSNSFFSVTNLLRASSVLIKSLAISLDSLLFLAISSSWLTNLAFNWAKSLLDLVISFAASLVRL